MEAADIKRIRESLNMTQAAFAYFLGVSFVTINRWENGKQKISDLAQERVKNVLKKNKVKS